MTRDACWVITELISESVFSLHASRRSVVLSAQLISIISDACLCYGETVNIVLGVICSMNALLTFPVSYENVISECFLNFQNVQFFKCVKMFFLD